MTLHLSTPWMAELKSILCMLNSYTGSLTSLATSGFESDVRGWRSTSPIAGPNGVDLMDDVIICGRCKLRFTTASQLVEHRRTASCQLRFACRCRDDEVDGRRRKNSTESGLSWNLLWDLYAQTCMVQVVMLVSQFAYTTRGCIVPIGFKSGAISEREMWWISVKSKMVAKLTTDNHE